MALISVTISGNAAPLRNELSRAEERFGKFGGTINKMATAATGAFVGLAAGLSVATKAAMEDAAAQAQLALTLRNVTAASEAQIASVEKQISAMSMASGIADDQLRPAFEALTRGTKDIDLSMRDMTLVMDIATATQRPLVDVADALAKAYQGNTKGLRQLTPEMATLIREGASMDQIMQVLGGTFGGATKVFAETAQGGFARLTVAINETKESIGAALLPIVERALPSLNRFATWASENPQVFTRIAAAIGVVTASIVAMNVAMNANPIVLFTTYTIAATAAVAALRDRFNGLPSIIRNVIDQLSRLLAPLLAIVDAYNAVAGVLRLPKITLNPTEVIPSTTPAVSTGSSTWLAQENRGSMLAPIIPAMGGGVSLGGGGGGGGGSRLGGGGGGGGGGGTRPVSTISPDDFMAGLAAADFFSSGLDNPRVRGEAGMTVNVNVNGALSTKAEIGEAVQQALRAATSVYGPLDVQIA